jgi:hypothetical protein
LKTAVINNLQVAPDRQGRRIGHDLTRLQVASIEADDVSVDIFEGSTASFGLYESLGFLPIHKLHWHVLEPSDAPAPVFVLRDLPQADAAHAAFDVSVLHVETPEGSHAVGRMGDDLFRVTTTAAIQDESLLPALAALDRGRRVLAILDAQVDPLPGPPTQVSVRLAAPLEVVASKLRP